MASPTPYAVIAESECAARNLATEIAEFSPAWRGALITDRLGALRRIENARPEVVTISLDGDAESAFVLVQRLRARFSGIAIIAVARKAASDSNREREQGEVFESCRAAFRAGASEFLTRPIRAEEWSKTIQSVSTQQKSTEALQKGKMIVLIGACGGVGTTTVACNTAAAMAQEHPNQVVLVDWNFRQGDIAVMLDCHATFSVADLLYAGQDGLAGAGNFDASWKRLDRTLVQSALVHHDKTLNVLVQPDLVGLDEELNVEQSVELFAILQNMFPYVIVDAGRGVSRENSWLINQADTIVLLGLQDLHSIHNVRRCLALLEELDIDLKRVRYVLNRYDRRHRISAQKAAEAVERDVSSSIPLDCKILPDSINSGQSVHAIRPNSVIAKSFETLAGSLNGAVSVAKRKRGFSLFSRRNIETVHLNPVGEQK